MNELLDGEIAYTDVTALPVDEKAWLLDQVFPDLYRLDYRVKHRLFGQLWDPKSSLVKGVCVDCLMPEGKCVNSACIRTRVTNKLHLYERTPPSNT